ncbi:MAG: hypothetical protein HY561_07465 [Gemmatimonadetes bacterium]|nr:hypothetical protein [Gemmatimonadota bacterium]
MQHLNPELLAQLVDEAAEPDAAAHLATCAECRAELEALRSQTAALRELPELAPRAAEWNALEARLEAEGLLRSESAHGAGPGAPWPGTHGRDARRGGAGWRGAAFLRMAAALAIFLLGGMAGAALRGRLQSEGAQRGPAIAAVPASSEEAARSVRLAETAYLDALGRYLELSGTGAATDPVTRLAALESIVLTTREALGAAPADPVINGYHLAALAQRNATLQQLAVAREGWF